MKTTRTYTGENRFQQTVPGKIVYPHVEEGNRCTLMTLQKYRFKMDQRPNVRAETLRNKLWDCT